MMLVGRHTSQGLLEERASGGAAESADAFDRRRSAHGVSQIELGMRLCEIELCSSHVGSKKPQCYVDVLRSGG